MKRRKTICADYLALFGFNFSRIGEVWVLFDAMERHKAIEKLVTREGADGQERRYYRFRPARWYGGIATADCTGCGLLCRFCWVSDRAFYTPMKARRFYSASAVAQGLAAIAAKLGIKQLRISGGEPSIGKIHLLQVLDNLKDENYRFILETNGIPIACDDGYTEKLAEYPFIHVRVSLKGCDEQEFSMLTGAKPEDFKLQLKDLEKLVKADVSCHPSVMASFSPKTKLAALAGRLKRISPKFAEELEIEELILYPHVVNRIQRYGLKYHSGYAPENVPSSQI